MANKINKELDYGTYAMAYQRQDQMLKKGTTQIGNSISKFEIMETFQGHADLVQFFVDRIWSEERVQRVKTIPIESAVLRQDKANSEKNKARLEELKKKKAALQQNLREKSANVMVLQAQIKKKRDEELQQTEEAVLKANTRKVFIQRYLSR